MEVSESMIDFEKAGGLVPAIIQDVKTQKVLMMGYMNVAAFEKTRETNKVWFFSRSRNKLWMKGETSGNVLLVVDMKIDCDRDTILVKVMPQGPVCHTGDDTCWGEINEENPTNFIQHLQSIIEDRKQSMDDNSYTSSLFRKGINKIAQKVGEEAVELVIEAKDDNKDLFLGEAADLLYHYLVLLSAKNLAVNDVIRVLKQRHK